MYLLKGSKYLYLVDYNEELHLPVWSNQKEAAIVLPDYAQAMQLQAFLNAQHGILYEIESK